MSTEKNKKQSLEVKEPTVAYTGSQSKIALADQEDFNFDAEFSKGYTPEEAKAEALKRIREWWGK
ncbi:hypothetical protein FFWV33_01425 [Flavobacterium faecale]|uniref:Uncharacterized protein n=1 Tax=Flavobacterium faecale TaxID=1355330 RepID=A0A2S1L956_9FLAO|nr:hypothetical protein [Flavobacterium faecale]AWG20280.1 hypothetical protein FFWV33_01425 [Flavobacterium faecale]